MSLRHPNYFSCHHLNDAYFIGTYRGLSVVILEPRTMGSKLTLNTHGYHTRTTVRVLNLCFEAIGIPWRASLKSGSITIQTDQNTHTLGDIEYVIFTSRIEKNSRLPVVEQII